MRRSTLATIVFVLLGACSGPSSEDGTTPTTPSTTSPPASTSAPTAPGEPSAPVTPTATASPTPTSTGPPASRRTPLDAAAVAWEVAGEGFQGPLQVLEDPRDGATLVVEQVGRIRTLAGGVVLDLRSRVTSGGERGLLGVAFHPDGSRLFVHYSGDAGRTVLSEFPVGPDSIPADEETVLLTEPQPARNHNGGAVVFSPDGALVLALGDGGAAGDQFDNGQDTDTRLGGLLRFDVDTRPGELVPYPGNPFTDGGAPGLWAYGLRNPWRIAFTDSHLYVADVGQDAVEEVSVVPREDVTGANFGWPILEGTACYRDAGCSAEGTIAPVAELRHAEGACSIIGGVVVPDGSPTGLGGAYVYSDLCDTRLHALRRGDDGLETSVVEGGGLPASPLGFGEGADDEVWAGTTDGQVLRLRPA